LYWGHIDVSKEMGEGDSLRAGSHVGNNVKAYPINRGEMKNERLGIGIGGSSLGAQWRWGKKLLRTLSGSKGGVGKKRNKTAGEKEEE